MPAAFIYLPLRTTSRRRQEVLDRTAAEKVATTARSSLIVHQANHMQAWLGAASCIGLTDGLLLTLYLPMTDGNSKPESP